MGKTQSQLGSEFLNTIREQLASSFMLHFPLFCKGSPVLPFPEHTDKDRAGRAALGSEVQRGVPTLATQEARWSILLQAGPKTVLNAQA